MDDNSLCICITGRLILLANFCCLFKSVVLNERLRRDTEAPHGGFGLRKIGFFLSDRGAGSKTTGRKPGELVKACQRL